MKWCVCESCLGTGKKKQKKRKNTIKLESDSNVNFKINKAVNSSNSSFKKCSKCEGKGIVSGTNFPDPDYKKFPHIAIVGLGIGGATLAIACLHRGIPFTIFERDSSFSARSQGYGLTLQQASKITKSLGIESFKEGVVSTRHLVHDVFGNILATWGMRKWIPDEIPNDSKKTNLHIARQELRLVLLNQFLGEKQVFWNHKLIRFDSNIMSGNTLHFLVNGVEKVFKADLIVGADGIRSTVRNLLFENTHKPLKYLGCIVILGICNLEKLQYLNSDLFDSATVFQTANGKERIYVMPYSKDAIMWQLSFPMEETLAISLSKLGASSLKDEAIKRTNWHSPIPDIITKTEENLITGYPVYDREVLGNELKIINKPVTLIGDAAHPMSPFKGQGANQAMLDGLALARLIYSKYQNSDFQSILLREDILNDFETEMIKRSSVKVKESSEAALFLHSEDVLNESDQPRRKAKNND